MMQLCRGRRGLEKEQTSKDRYRAILWKRFAARMPNYRSWASATEAKTRTFSISIVKVALLGRFYVIRILYVPQPRLTTIHSQRYNPPCE